MSNMSAVGMGHVQIFDTDSITVTPYHCACVINVGTNKIGVIIRIVEMA